jgi:DAACS family dicarboxylate/amino acid:cation (Na+ or H+) symporter
MNGTALFEAATAITLAQTFAIPLSAGQVASVLGLCVLTSIGTAGVPGGAIPLLAGVLVLVGIPGEAIALVLGIDRVLDMARSTVNVLGNLSAVAYVAHAEGEWTADAVPSLQPQVAEQPA